MEQSVKAFVTEKTKEVLNAGSACQELKDAAQAWLDALGTDKEAEVSKAYVQELEEDVTSIDGLISFAESEMGARVFGEEAGAVAEHGRQVKSAGGKYCDCPACAAVEAILSKKEELLG